MTALHWQDVRVQRGGHLALDGVSIEVAAGELVAVVGPNGAGKTTLLAAALDLVRPDSGRVSLDGRGSGSFLPLQRAAKVAWLPQHGRTSEPVQVVDRVAAARFRFGASHADDRVAALVALQAAGVPHLADRSLDTLSGGEAQRVALAALLAQEATAWLLDEPGNHLDPRVQVTVYGFLGQAWRDGRTIVCVTHDVNLLTHAVRADETDRVRIIGLGQGRVAFDRKLADPDLPEALSDLLGVRVHPVQVEGRRHLVLGSPA